MQIPAARSCVFGTSTSSSAEDSESSLEVPEEEEVVAGGAGARTIWVGGISSSSSESKLSCDEVSSLEDDREGAGAASAVAARNTSGFSSALHIHLPGTFGLLCDKSSYLPWQYPHKQMQLQPTSTDNANLYSFTKKEQLDFRCDFTSVARTQHC